MGRERELVTVTGESNRAWKEREGVKERENVCVCCVWCEKKERERGKTDSRFIIWHIIGYYPERKDKANKTDKKGEECEREERRCVQRENVWEDRRKRRTHGKEGE